MVHGVAYVEEPVVEVDVAQSEAAYLADVQPPTGRLSRMHRAGSIRGVFLCFCQLLGELTCRDSGWLSWARFALPVASGVLSRVARFRLRGLVPGRGRRF